MMDALSCGAVVLGSATAPVKEMIRDGENGLLADFFKPEEFAEKAVQVLRDPDAFRELGRAGEKMIVERYSLDAVLPEMMSMYQEAANMSDTLPSWEIPAAMPVTQQLAIPPGAVRKPTTGASAPGPAHMRPKPRPGKGSPFLG
jgi:hypothetical protein